MEEIIKNLYSRKQIMRDIHSERNGMCCTTNITITEDLGEHLDLIHFLFP